MAETKPNEKEPLDKRAIVSVIIYSWTDIEMNYFNDEHEKITEQYKSKEEVSVALDKLREAKKS